MKPPLLFLCHRLPFPPDKGDKITTYNVLLFLSRHFDVYLGCFIDDKRDRQFIGKVQEYCVEVGFAPLNRQLAKLSALQALLGSEPITVPYYRHRRLQKWVDKTLSGKGIDTIFVYSGCMAQYVSHLPANRFTRVMHFADIDSDKWQQYANKCSGIMQWVYNRESRLLAGYEKEIADEFAVSCFVSDAESALFRTRMDAGQKAKIRTLANGIDIGYFDPDGEMELAESYPVDIQDYLVFTGAMDYWANADAVIWFADKVWPLILLQHPDALFYIVGSKPGADVKALAQRDGIVVTGRVVDVRPYLKYAKAAVAPMQIARGIQNKILEAMAMEKPVAATPLAMEGLDDYPEENVISDISPENLAEWLNRLIDGPMQRAEASRCWLIDNYSWETKLSPLLGYLSKDESAERGNQG